MTNDNTTSLDKLRDQAEFFIKRRAEDKATADAIGEAQALINTLKQSPCPDRKICADLRGFSMKSYRRLPVIAAHFDLMADQIDRHHPR